MIFTNNITKIKNNLLVFGVIIIAVVVLLVPSANLVFAQNEGYQPSAAAALVPGLGSAYSGAKALNQTLGIDLFEAFAKGISSFLMGFSGNLLTLAGSLFDAVVKFSVIDMGANLGSEKMGGSITNAWRTLRDIANMLFIFVLLFVAFKAMFELDFGSVGKSVKNIIIVALLINFSLFFSKVIIDASNIVSVGFYNSIVTANTRSVSGSGEGNTSTVGTQSISTGYMKLLGLTSWFSPVVLTDSKMQAKDILLLGILSSVFLLITAVILIISSIMFAARFIILVFLMILSPLAFIAYIIPSYQSQATKWWEALLNQSFFAPLFLALTWVVFKVGSSLNAQTSVAYTDLVTKSPTSASATLLLNYTIIIGLSIAALVISKTMATKTAYFTTLSSGIGTGLIGGAAFAGRQTLGRIGKGLADKPWLQKAANEGNWLARSAARPVLYAGKQARSASFDARNASVPTSVVGDLIQGTVGRTKLGKKIGLDDVNISNIDIANRLGKDIIGTGGTKGYRELKEESGKRTRASEAEVKSEFKLSQTKEDVLKGAQAAPGTTGPVIDAMEKSLSSLSDKETETLVASNRDLLESQNFANKISVKQLDTLIKSDQFSEAEKKKLKDARFETINDPDNLTALSTPTTLRTPDQVDRAKKISKSIKGLSDSELEMIDSERLKNDDFIAELRPAQAEAIIKSSKFTTSQKDDLRERRRSPLLKALDTLIPSYSPNPSIVKDMITKRLSPKDVAGLMATEATFVDHTGATVKESILTHPEVMKVYTPSLLKRMAPEMNSVDIQKLRDFIEDAGTTPGASPEIVALAAWLSKPDGAAFS